MTPGSRPRPGPPWCLCSVEHYAAPEREKPMRQWGSCVSGQCGPGYKGPGKSAVGPHTCLASAHERGTHTNPLVARLSGKTTHGWTARALGSRVRSVSLSPQGGRLLSSPCYVFGSLNGTAFQPSNVIRLLRQRRKGGAACLAGGGLPSAHPSSNLASSQQFSAGFP